MADKGKGKELTDKQKKFVSVYDGNIKTSANKAGLSYGYCRRLVTKSNIIAAIKDRENKRLVEGILTREERQFFWSQVAKGEITEQVVVGNKDDKRVEEIKPKLSDRLKASELLGRSEADFTDNVKVEEVKPLVVFDEDE